MKKTAGKTSKKIAQQELVLIEYRKGKIKGAIIAYNFPGIGYGFRTQGDEKIECYSRRFKGKIPCDFGKEFKTLRAAKKYMARHGYKEVKAKGAAK